MSLTVKKRKGSPHWQISGSLDGERIRQSSETTDKRVAQQIAAQIESDFWNSRFHGPASVLTFMDAVTLYRAAGKSTRFLKPIEEHWNETPVREIKAGAIKASARELYPEASPATWNRQVIVPTQAIINHAAELEKCPPIRVKRFPVPKRRQDYATWAWVERFMDHATTPEIGALACFMFCTGARSSDALGLTWGRVDLSRAIALVDSRKTDMDDWAHLPEPLVVALANLKGPRGKSDPVFPYKDRFEVRAPWKATVKAASLQRMTPKACRHGFATAMLREGFDPKTVAKRGRWASPSQVLETYGHAMEDITIVDAIVGTKSAHGTRKRSSIK